MYPSVHYTIIVRGRVQGVGFRAAVLKLATNLGLKGCVKNLSNGSVYIEVEGPEPEVDLFIEQCKSGPGWSRVDKLDLQMLPVEGLEPFRITY